MLLRGKLRGLDPDLITVRYGWNDHFLSECAAGPEPLPGAGQRARRRARGSGAAHGALPVRAAPRASRCARGAGRAPTRCASRSRARRSGPPRSRCPITSTTCAASSRSGTRAARRSGCSPRPTTRRPSEAARNFVAYNNKIAYDEMIAIHEQYNDATRARGPRARRAGDRHGRGLSATTPTSACSSRATCPTRASGASTSRPTCSTGRSWRAASPCRPASRNAAAGPARSSARGPSACALAALRAARWRHRPRRARSTASAMIAAEVSQSKRRDQASAPAESRVASASSASRPQDRLGEPRHQRVRRAVGDQHAGLLVAHGVAQAGCVGRDDRDTERIRLDHGDPPAFLDRGTHADAGAGEQRVAQLVAREAGEARARRETELARQPLELGAAAAAPDDHDLERGKARRERRERAQQQVDPLVAFEPAEVGDAARPRGDRRRRRSPAGGCRCGSARSDPRRCRAPPGRPSSSATPRGTGVLR